MGKTFVFLIQQLVLAAVFYVILVSSGSFNFGQEKKKDTDIKIGLGNTTTGELALEPSGTVLVDKGKKVTWFIDTNISNVESFWIEKKDRSNSKQIFYIWAHPPSRPTKRGAGTVDILRSKGTEYEYYIYWNDDLGNPHTFDPKIAIRPSTNVAAKIIYVAYGLAALIVSLLFFLSRNKK